ncbi:beta strand repeat-containing protein [Aurantiacibacter spongiae]|uniref:Uncharacterized protein n=1 Tax=Aurantiacibacter spongiae TaxID=2488860 RepID=A0A3N5CR09_9SPHN|nr:hypothetical protein [Aurantiacibacter spongiae]RPF70776.1 hypothetical protein EG799_03425 [Aurantiacibacter spongiae]
MDVLTGTIEVSRQVLVPPPELPDYLFGDMISLRESGYGEAQPLRDVRNDGEIVASLKALGILTQTSAAFDPSNPDASTFLHTRASGIETNAAPVVTIVNDARITVDSQVSLAIAGSTAISSIAGADLSALAIANAFGIRRGSLYDPSYAFVRDGEELYPVQVATINAGNISVSTAAAATLGQVDLVARVGTTAVDTGARTRAFGIAGHSRFDDFVLNNGSITVTGEAIARRGSGSNTALDGGASDASVSADARVIGVDGLGGNDYLDNSGLITAASRASVESVYVALAIGQYSGSAASLDPVALAVGMAGGRGNDTLSNGGIVSVSAATSRTNTRGSVSLFDLSIIDAAVSSAPAATEDRAVQAQAIVLDGGAGADRVTAGEGSLSQFTADADALSVSVDAGFAGIPASLTVLGNPQERLFDFDTRAAAMGAGFAGGLGADELLNGGTLEGSVHASANQTGISVSLPGALMGGLGDVLGAIPDFSTVGAAAIADARFTAMTGDGGNDIVANTGAIDVAGKAEALAIAASIAIPDVPGDVPSTGLAAVDASVAARIAGEGLAGGTGDDSVVNGGPLSLAGAAEAEAWNASFNAMVQKSGSLNAVFMRGDASATGAMLGLDGGTGDDSVTNDAVIAMNGTASASQNGLSVAFNAGNYGGANATALQLGADADFAFTGMAGGEGSDVLTNTGELDLTSAATAEANSLTLNGTASNGISVSGVALQAGARAGAASWGMAGGSPGGASIGEEDYLLNAGGLTSSARADAATRSLAIVLAGSKGGASGGIAGSDMSADARSQAIGLYANAGSSRIVNDGIVLTQAGAGSVVEGLGLNLALDTAGGGAGTANVASSRSHAATGATAIQLDGEGSIGGAGSITALSNATAKLDAVQFAAALGQGPAIAATLTDASSVAEADAAGIRAASASPTSIDQGATSALANAIADSSAMDFGVSYSAQTAAVSATLGRSETSARADGRGVISAGQPVDYRQGRQTTVRAGARATQFSGAFSLNVSNMTSIGASLLDASTISAATGAGIDFGDGSDTVALSARTDVAADAKTRSSVLRAGMGYSQSAMAGQVSAARIGASADASATGVATGGGDDRLTADALADLVIDSHADSGFTLIDAKINASTGGFAGSVTLADSSNRALASGGGYSLGAGDDTLASAAYASARADAVAETLGISASVDFSTQGAAAGLVLMRAGTDADALAISASGGAGSDTLALYGVVADASARSSGTSATLSLAIAAEGASLSLTGIDLGVDATATAVGIAGDEWMSEGEAPSPGDDDDIITTVADSAALADAHASGLAVALSVPVSYVPLGAALIDANVAAQAVATGIDAGGGNDAVTLDGGIAALAGATSSGTSIAFTLAGASLGDLSVTAGADAAAVRLGSGNDTLLATGVVNSGATATLSGLSIAANLGGGAISAFDQIADAATIGIDAGEGDDAVLVDTISTAALTRSGAGNFAINLVGAALPDTAVSLRSRSGGVAGGGGNDTIGITGGMESSSLAQSDSLTVSATLAGAAAAASGVTLESAAFGVDGGDGNDSVEVSGGIVAARADMTGASAAASLAGYSSSRFDAVASARSVGVEGGMGDDYLSSTGYLQTNADALVGGENIAIGLLGEGRGAMTMNAVADATGLRGGEGADLFAQTGFLTTTATAGSSSRSLAIQLAGNQPSSAQARNTAVAVGVDGGEGNDVASLRVVGVSATATGSASGMRFQLAGNARSNFDVAADARAIGVDMGLDDDFLRVGLVQAIATSDVATADGGYQLVGNQNSDVRIASHRGRRRVRCGSARGTTRSTCPTAWRCAQTRRPGAGRRIPPCSLPAGRGCNPKSRRSPSLPASMRAAARMCSRYPEPM